jgi:hypothetical protein
MKAFVLGGVLGSASTSVVLRTQDHQRQYARMLSDLHKFEYVKKNRAAAAPPDPDVDRAIELQDACLTEWSKNVQWTERLFSAGPEDLRDSWLVRKTRRLLDAHYEIKDAEALETLRRNGGWF